jgi:hypothetical protein
MAIRAERRRGPHDPIAWRNRDRTANFRRSSYWRVEPAFRISFYRAARSLIEAGMLLSCDDKGSREVRFVSCAPIAKTSIKAPALVQGEAHLH